MEVILLAFRRHKQLKGLLDILVRGGQCDWPARFCLRREICVSSVFQGWSRRELARKRRQAQ